MNEVADNVEVAAEPAAEAPVDGSQSGAVDRPTWLPEKFETPEALATSYGELESKIGQSRDAIRDEVRRMTGDSKDKIMVIGVHYVDIRPNPLPHCTKSINRAPIALWCRHN